MSREAFSEQYRDQLADMFGAQLTEQVTADPMLAYASDPAYGATPYVCLQAGAGERPILYVPGFAEGIVNKAPFAAALAERGLDVTFPDQNHKGIMRDPETGKKSATYSQAVNYLTVIEAEKLAADGPVDIVAHSYGGLIFNEMARIANRRELPYFEDSNVIMLAVAGINQDSLPSLGKRWLQMTLAEAKTNKDFPDPKAASMKASMRNIAANPLRSAREVWELTHNQIDAAKLMSYGLGSLAIVSYAQDPLYGAHVIEPAMGAMLEAGASWSEPYAQQLLADGRFRGGKDASHDDEQLNPSRVANTVAQLLQKH